MSEKKLNLPDTLFEIDDDEEFQEMIRQVDAKVLRRKKKTRTIAASAFNRACVEVKEMMASNNWSSCEARHLIALYDLMHTKCYGVECVELGPSERYNAATIAHAFVRREFDSNFAKSIDFFRWVWNEEIRKERWCRDNNVKRSSRIHVRGLFRGELLTNYRLELVRKRHRR